MLISSNFRGWYLVPALITKCIWEDHVGLLSTLSKEGDDILFLPLTPSILSHPFFWIQLFRKRSQAIPGLAAIPMLSHSHQSQMCGCQSTLATFEHLGFHLQPISTSSKTPENKELCCVFRSINVLRVVHQAWVLCVLLDPEIRMMRQRLAELWVQGVCLCIIKAHQETKSKVFSCSRIQLASYLIHFYVIR